MNSPECNSYCICAPQEKKSTLDRLLSNISVRKFVKNTTTIVENALESQTKTSDEELILLASLQCGRFRFQCT
jgi:hypothetical protein